MLCFDLWQLNVFSSLSVDSDRPFGDTHEIYKCFKFIIFYSTKVDSATDGLLVPQGSLLYLKNLILNPQLWTVKYKQN